MKRAKPICRHLRFSPGRRPATATNFSLPSVNDVQLFRAVFRGLRHPEHCAHASLGRDRFAVRVCGGLEMRDPPQLRARHGIEVFEAARSGHVAILDAPFDRDVERNDHIASVMVGGCFRWIILEGDPRARIFGFRAAIIIGRHLPGSLLARVTRAGDAHYSQQSSNGLQFTIDHQWLAPR